MHVFKSFTALVAFSLTWAASAQSVPFDRTNQSKFRQLGTELPTPNSYRTASGAPGAAYYQQQADYDLEVWLNEDTHVLKGSGTITYTNNSPDVLEYVWLQLDQNEKNPNSVNQKITRGNALPEKMTPERLEDFFYDFPGGFTIDKMVQNGKPLKYTVVNTMMRVDLPQPLKAGQVLQLQMAWHFTINDRMQDGGRSGYEHFKEENNTLYTLAQFFPRMAVYGDNVGWQHKQFLGMGEFTLPFGNYRVRIHVPGDHVVAATGELQNESDVLTAEQRRRYAKARTALDQPVFIVTQKEAEAAEKGRVKSEKTWEFKATNVRDFAFATSRKFIWDAMGVRVGGKTVMAESFYPKEGNPLWEQYSTRVVAQTIATYSKFTVDYTYPRALSVHTADIGMEYPMICFNGGRPEPDGTYSEGTKYGMIGVIIHEVGHNFFPMIINSDERDWTWMDEGLNTFVQYLTEVEWDRDYPARRGPAYKIVDYMKSPASSQVPIMTNSESLLQFGNNAYGKPATALNILRETVLGRELFDFAFKTYCERWAFKHPSPADFFRTMEDASGTDLDWFWRGWFYTTEPCDQALTKVRIAAMPDFPAEAKARKVNTERERRNAHIGYVRNQKSNSSTVVDRVPEASDYYNSAYKREELTKAESALAKANAEAQKAAAAKRAGTYFHELTITNKGGLIMPVVIRFTLENGQVVDERLPAEVWLRNENEFLKTFVLPGKAVRIELDPQLETADIDTENNVWPASADTYLEWAPSGSGRGGRPANPMQEAGLGRK